MSNNNRHEIFEKSVPMLVVGIIFVFLRDVWATVIPSITVPLAHAEELYALRNNIDAVRRRLLAKRPG